MAKAHSLVERADRLIAYMTKNPPCCATMKANIHAHEKVPEWIGNRCPWCRAALSEPVTPSARIDEEEGEK